MEMVNNPVTNCEMSSYQELYQIAINLNQQLASEIVELNEEDENSDSVAFLNTLKLKKLEKVSDFIRQRLIEIEVSTNKNNSNGNDLQKILHDITKTINFETFRNGQILEETRIEYEKELQKTKNIEDGIANELADSANNSEVQIMAGFDNNGNRQQHANEDVSELRKRLLSTRTTQFDTDPKTYDEKLQYHEEQQTDILNELSSMVGAIKNGVYKLSDLIEEDKDVLKKTSSNLEDSSSRMGTMYNKLKEYHEKDRLGYWYYIKLVLGIVVAFVVILFVISVL
ncbi:hypothetical protein PACTADRAFT_49047 [Pachysolen tannophilus NRRL Y-2460]|uniref:t-SNARE coiled-coil homology domain-containing protein n=1 Tax=Pachysolen tannophilus NRRL Y-2460 TaxID=669874 RepID=A0A1E4U007_PACTA|nr:hypothetical protein PACTADRAFT_49047 [Pachysolen tannophilus NRRL Y-2460]